MTTLALALCLLLTSAVLEAQTVGLNDRLPPLSAPQNADAEYRLGPGDLIEIRVFGVPNFNHDLRIAATGTIRLPLVEPIVAAGLTPAQLEQRLVAALDGELIRNPQVSVFVKEYRSQPVFVMGAVVKPGQYQVSLALSIVDVLSMAGGLQPNAGDELVIQRRSEPNAPVEMIKIDLRALLERGDLSLNVRVQGGDIINIQERVARTVFVLGEVTRAGAYQLPPKQDLRVSQAFAWAGGPMKTAKMNDGRLVRYENGERKEITVNFEDILKGKKEDFLVQADDIIFVPGSTFKNLGWGLLGMLPNTLLQVPYYLPR
jgi:polysaccharide export outer membrane protein